MCVNVVRLYSEPFCAVQNNISQQSKQWQRLDRLVGVDSQWNSRGLFYYCTSRRNICTQVKNLLWCQQWRIQKFLKRGQKTIYQLRPHLLQMRTTKYMPFTREKRLFKKYEPIGGGSRPHRPRFESATGRQLNRTRGTRASTFMTSGLAQGHREQ